MGDIKYLRSTYQYQQYIPLTKQYTAAFNAEVGLGAAAGGHAFPVFKSFYGGGLGSVRGFEQGSLGPKDANGTVLGGDRKLNVNMEILTPFPGAGNDRTLRLYGFVDAGMIGGTNNGSLYSADANSLRVSTGVGISWISPVGPLRLAFAKPLRKFDGDRIQAMQFQIGTSF
jgi:outer membrane protein insertion porin family